MGALAQSVRAVPVLSARVMDETGTLTAVQNEALSSKLAALEKQTGAQLLVLIVETTAPEDIAVFAQRAGDTWKLGRKNVGDGLLLVVAKQDRKIRIEVAKALEGAIPDLAASRVIAQTIAPRFQQGDFPGGLDAGIQQLSDLIRGEQLPAPQDGHRDGSGFQWMDLAVFLFFASAVGGSMARRALGTRKGSMLIGAGCTALVFYVTQTWWLALLAGLAGLLMTLISSLSRVGTGAGGMGSYSGGHSGSWPGSDSGGGFRSGGGGNFGGGGASGGW
nr:TPM domain-containing protein [uncultured Rhodoferax sp.]